MRAIPSLIAATILATSFASAQTLQQHTPADDVTHLNAGTQLVIVDVVVQDHDGHPVHGLKREDFQINENKSPQTIHSFEEHTAPPRDTKAPAMPPLPPGIFTNYTPVPPSGTLNILLLDSLNTPMKDQGYVRYQLQQYVNKADPGTRIAIFGLTTRLTILQGFTSDPKVLKDAVDHKLIPRSSVLLDDPVGTDTDSLMSTDLGGQVSANVAQFEAMNQSFQLQLRLQYTLDAFNMLARYVSGFPGRKNLIWFSGSFPLDILPDATLADPFAVVASGEDEFRETTNLLTRAQVAVYPIDARGLMTNPMFDASNSGHNRTGPTFAAGVGKFNEAQASEHITMEAMANDTGGHAYYNTNGLADAVAKAIEAGSNYYSITYTPTDRRQTGDYRHINVALTGSHAAQGLQLAYRQGYFSNDAKHPNNSDQATFSSTLSIDDHAAASYAQAAMARGAPTPEDILFKVRVLPTSTTPEDTLAPGNVSDPRSTLKGPYRRLSIDYAALATSLTFTAQPKGAIEFTTLVYTPDGQLINAMGKTIELNLNPDQYQRYLQAAHSGAGAQAHLEVSVPIKQQTYLRIAIHDIPSNRFGVVEVPTSTVIHLPPATTTTAPPTSTTTPPSPTPTSPQQ
jgi:VWFA-related protein